ncbi:MAG: DsbC family protein [Cellvibrionaceae bacterium]
MNIQMEGVKRFVVISILSVLLVSVSVWAEQPTAEMSKRILDNLKEARPDLQFSGAVASPIDGLYEVRVQGGPTLYVSENAEFFVAGDLFSIENGKFVNIQEKARAKERAAVMAKIDKKDQIVFSPKGETKAVLHVFTDVDCGYCQKLHNEIQAINDKGIEVRYLAYPRSGPNSESGQKLATAWCAKDRQGTLTKLKTRQSVPMATCDDNPVADQYKLGGSVGVNGTPNMVTETGEMIGGYLPADQLATMLGIAD